jgi:hypothetical protein
VETVYQQEIDEFLPPFPVAVAPIVFSRLGGEIQFTDGGKSRCSHGVNLKVHPATSSDKHQGFKQRRSFSIIRHIGN